MYGISMEIMLSHLGRVDAFIWSSISYFTGRDVTADHSNQSYSHLVRLLGFLMSDIHKYGAGMPILFPCSSYAYFSNNFRRLFDVKSRCTAG